MNISTESWNVLIIGTFITVLISYYFYCKSRKEPIACYSIRSLNVIDVTHSTSSIGEKITVNYENKPISRLSVATVTFWNGGNLLLSRETLLPRQQPRICISPGGKILEAAIVTDPNSDCECRILIDQDNFPNSVLLDFHFLEPGDGIVVRVLHTGQREAIDVVGKLKGVRLENACGSAKKYDSTLEFINYWGWILLVVILLTFTALVQFHTWIGLPEAFFDAMLLSSSIITKSLLGLSLFMMIGHIFISFLKKTTSRRIPKELVSP